MSRTVIDVNLARYSPPAAPTLRRLVVTANAVTTSIAGEEFGNVWMGSVRMSRSGTVDTTLERAWSLLASPAAYSLAHMFGFVFELPVRPSASGRLFFTVGRGAARGTGHIFEVIEETPQKRVRLLGRSVQQVGQWSVSAAVSPSRHGVRIELGMEVPCPRANKTDYQTRVAKDLKGWLSAVTAVLADRSPWPPTELPDELRQAIETAPRAAAHGQRLCLHRSSAAPGLAGCVFA